MFQLILLWDGYLPQFLNDTIKMSLCPNSKWDDDLPVGTDFFLNHLLAFICKIWISEWPLFSSRVLESFLWVSSRQARHLLRMRSISFQTRSPLSYQETRFGELSPSWNGNIPKWRILGSILSGFSIHNTVSLNCTIIHSGEASRAQSYRKSVPVFCLLPPNHFLFWSHILCWKTESTNAFKFLSHKRLERGKESFYVRITCEGWMAVAFLRHEQLLYNTCQGPRWLQDKVQSQLLPTCGLRNRKVTSTD